MSLWRRWSGEARKREEEGDSSYLFMGTCHFGTFHFGGNTSGVPQSDTSPITLRQRTKGTGLALERGQVPPKEEGGWSMFCNMPCVDLSPFCGENRPGVTYQKAGLEVHMSDYKIQLPGSEKSVSKRTVDCSSRHGSVVRVHRPRFFANPEASRILSERMEPQARRKSWETGSSAGRRGQVYFCGENRPGFNCAICITQYARRSS